MATLQTLDRGIRVLELVAHRENGSTITELAERLAVDRAIAYRLVATLESRGLVSRSTGGRIFLGGGLAALASGMEPQLRALALPNLETLAAETGATAYLSVAQGGECVVVLVAEPQARIIRVGYRVGSRHPLDVGAAGIAILSGRRPHRDDSVAVHRARADGYALTRGQIQADAVGVGVPVLSTHEAVFRFESCVGVVAMSDLNVNLATRASVAHAHRIALAIGQ